MTSHKANAIDALIEVGLVLAGDEPITGLMRAKLAASIDYAAVEVEAIEELVRARRKRALETSE